MTDTRCWCCGTKLVDEARLRAVRVGPIIRRPAPTGVMVCPYRCPSREEAARQKAEAAEPACATITTEPEETP